MRTFRYALLVAIVGVLSLPLRGSAQTAQRYVWTHVVVGDSMVLDGSETVLSRTLNTLESNGWEIFTIAATQRTKQIALQDGTVMPITSQRFDIVARRPHEVDSAVGTIECTTPKPGQGWTCSNGGWLPPQ